MLVVPVETDAARAAADTADSAAPATLQGTPAQGFFEAGPTIVRRGALTLHADPPEILWRGERIALSPLEQDLVTILMQRGRAPWEVFEAQLKITAETRDTLVHRIRRKFRAAGAADPIETIRHWGLRLRIERDLSRPGTVWVAGDGGPSNAPTDSRG